MFKALLAIIMLIVLAAAFGANKNSPPSSAVPKSSPYTVTLPPPPEPRSLVSISNFNWSKGGFGTVGLASFTIKNDNPFSVKDIVVICDFYGNSGTSLSRADATIYEAIAAKKSRTFREVNLGFIHSQSTKASCRILAVSR